MDDIGISTYLLAKQCDIRSFFVEALHWVPMHLPTHAHAHSCRRVLGRHRKKLPIPDDLKKIRNILGTQG